MKKISMLLIVVIAAAAVACNSSSGNGTNHNRHDTTKTLALFVNPQTLPKRELRYDVIYRIISDTLKFTEVDGSTLKKQWMLDTTYFISVAVPAIDSLKKPILDSVGKQMIQTYFVPRPSKDVLIDCGANIDSIIKKFYYVDTTKK